MAPTYNTHQHGIIRNMPDFRNIKRLVKYTESQNSVNDEHHSAWTISSNAYRLRFAIPFESLMNGFEKDSGLGVKRISRVYMDAKKLNLLEEFNPSHSPDNLNGVKVIVTYEGRNLVYDRYGLIHVIIGYFDRWSLTISVIAIVISIITLILQLTRAIG